MTNTRVAVSEAEALAADLDRLSSSHRPLLSAASAMLRRLANQSAGELIAFLNGEGPLEGLYFDESDRPERPRYWWRKYLSALTTQAADGGAIPAGGGAGREAGEPVYLIRKGGAYYRDNAEGYTRNRDEAGRYTLAEAISHSRPNGPDGQRDGIDYLPAPATLAQPDADTEGLRKALRSVRDWLAAAPDAEVL